MKIMKQEELVAKYEGAVVIYALQRKKKMTNKEKAFDWAVALLSPLPGYCGGSGSGGRYGQ